MNADENVAITRNWYVSFSKLACDYIKSLEISGNEPAQCWHSLCISTTTSPRVDPEETLMACLYRQKSE